jgi:hypothetical protein
MRKRTMTQTREKILSFGRFRLVPSRYQLFDGDQPLRIGSRALGLRHTPRNLASALDNRKKIAAAVTAGWHAFNITSEKAPASAAGMTTGSRPVSPRFTLSTMVAPRDRWTRLVEQSFSRMTESDIVAAVA